MVAVTYDKIVKTYVKMRDARSKLSAEFRKKDEEIKAQMERLELFMLEQMENSGVESFSSLGVFTLGFEIDSRLKLLVDKFVVQVGQFITIRHMVPFVYVY